MSTIGTFFGLHIGSSALAASQAAQEITGNNIANASTPGYTVEGAQLEAGIPTPWSGGYPNSTPGQFGSGVQIGAITRSRDQYLDSTWRNATSQQNTDQALNKSMTTVQSAFNEPGDNGINSALTAFYNSFNDVQNNPQDIGVRATALGKADSLARIFNTTQSSLASAQAQLTTQTNDDMTQLNAYGQQIAKLNADIRVATIAGQQPNALLDQRDQLIDKVAALANISTVANPDGTMNVSIGTTDLVNGINNYTVTLPGLQARGDIKEGAIAGLSQAQTALAGYQANLDTLASTLITQVNSIHQAGMGLDGSTGLPLFTGNNAATIGVNPTLVASPNKLAAAAFTSTAATPAPGDGSNAAAIANLATGTITSGPLAGNTISGYYTSMVTQIGNAVSSAATNAQVGTASVAQLTTQRSSVSGVSLDEEMTNMLQYQRSYQAAAQLINVQDGMLNTLINSMLSGN